MKGLSEFGEVVERAKVNTLPDQEQQYGVHKIEESVLRDGVSIITFQDGSQANINEETLNNFKLIL